MLEEILRLNPEQVLLGRFPWKTLPSHLAEGYRARPFRFRETTCTLYLRNDLVESR